MTDDEAIEIAVQHVLHDDLNWPLIVTEDQARVVVRRLRSETRGLSPEDAVARQPRIIDLTDPYYEQTA